MTPDNGASVKPIWTRRLERAADNLGLDDADRVYLAGLLKTWNDRDLRPNLENRSTPQIAAFLQGLLDEYDEDRFYGKMGDGYGQRIDCDGNAR